MHRDLHTEARDLLDRECRMAGIKPRVRHILAWVLGDMLEILNESHSEPADRLEPVIRRLIEERQFAEAAGDPVVEPDADRSIERQLAVALRVLESVRHQALSRGLWSSAPVTAQMAG